MKSQKVFDLAKFKELRANYFPLSMAKAYATETKLIPETPIDEAAIDCQYPGWKKSLILKEFGDLQVRYDMECSEDYFKQEWYDGVYPHDYDGNYVTDIPEQFEAFFNGFKLYDNEDDMWERLSYEQIDIYAEWQNNTKGNYKDKTFYNAKGVISVLNSCYPVDVLGESSTIHLTKDVLIDVWSRWGETLIKHILNLKPREALVFLNALYHEECRSINHLINKSSGCLCGKVYLVYQNEEILLEEDNIGCPDGDFDFVWDEYINHIASEDNVNKLLQENMEIISWMLNKPEVVLVVPVSPETVIHV